MDLSLGLLICSIDLYFCLHLSTSLIDECNLLTFRVIIMRTKHWHFIFSFFFSGCILYFFPCVSIWNAGLVVFYNDFLSFIFFMFRVSGFLFCGDYGACTKHLIDKIVFILLIASYLHLPIRVPSFSSFPFMILLSQIACLYVNLWSKWSSYSCYFYFFFPLNCIF